MTRWTKACVCPGADAALDGDAVMCRACGAPWAATVEAEPLADMHARRPAPVAFHDRRSWRPIFADRIGSSVGGWQMQRHGGPEQ